MRIRKSSRCGFATRAASTTSCFAPWRKCSPIPARRRIRPAARRRTGCTGASSSRASVARGGVESRRRFAPCPEAHRLPEAPRRASPTHAAMSVRCAGAGAGCSPAQDPSQGAAAADDLRALGLCDRAAAWRLYPGADRRRHGAGGHARRARAHHVRAHEEAAGGPDVAAAAARAGGSARDARAGRRGRSAWQEFAALGFEIARLAPDQLALRAIPSLLAGRGSGRRRARRALGSAGIGPVARASRSRSTICSHHGLPRRGARAPHLDRAGNERAAARDGGHRARRSMQPRPPDLGAVVDGAISIACSCADGEI